MQLLLNTDEVRERYATAGWERIIFSEFEAAMTSKSRPFPCVLWTCHGLMPLRFLIYAA